MPKRSVYATLSRRRDTLASAIKLRLRIRHIFGCQIAAKLAEAVVPVSGRIRARDFHREIVRSGAVRVFLCSSLTMTCGACAGSRRPRASRTPKSRSHGSRSPDLPVESGFSSTCGRSEGPKETCPLLGGAEKCDESLDAARLQKLNRRERTRLLLDGQQFVGWQAAGVGLSVRCEARIRPRPDRGARRWLS